MFGPEAKAKAKQVQRIRPVSERGSGERGHIIGAGPNGWLKVKWANRDKPTLIKRSELKLARGLRSLKNPIEIQRCTSCGQVFGQTTECPMCHAGVGIRRRNSKPSRGRVIAATKGALRGAQTTPLRASHVQRQRQLELKARLKRARTRTVKPKGRLPNGITEAAAGLQALEYLGGKVKKTSLGAKPKFNPRAKGSRDPLGVWHKENPIEHPWALGVKAIQYLQAMAGVRLDKAEAERLWAGMSWNQRTKTLAVYRQIRNAPKQKPERNPSVTTLSKTFQGEADGSIEKSYAATGAPANLARAGRLVFLKANGKTFRIPGAVVAIAPNEKLWIVGDHAPLFETKARNGEGLDVGEVTHICYETAKAHIGNGKTFEYVHEFGEDGGKRPHLIIDHEGMPLLRGGDYRIRAEGIVN